MFVKWLQSIIVSILLFVPIIGLGIWLDPDNGVIYFGVGLTFGVIWLGIVSVFHLIMYTLEQFILVMYKGEFIMFAKWLYNIFGSIVIWALLIGLGIWLNSENGMIYLGGGFVFGALWLGFVTVYYLIMYSIKVFTGKDYS